MVVPDPDDPGFWAVVRHADIKRVSHDNQTFVSGQGVFFDDIKRKDMGYLHFVRAPYAHATMPRNATITIATPAISTAAAPTARLGTRL